MGYYFYVTGTDTGVGKTVVSCTLLHAFRQQGLRAAGMKPVASGCTWSTQEWQNEDALELQKASGLALDYAEVNPYALVHPVAPEIAAKKDGVTIKLSCLQAAYAYLTSQADAVIVEGVGGWAASLAEGLDQADLVQAFDVPVILVVGLRLGCLNHARLSASMIVANGCRLSGWIASEVDPEMQCREENLILLKKYLHAPYLGCLPYCSQPDPSNLTQYLDITMLLDF